MTDNAKHIMIKRNAYRGLDRLIRMGSKTKAQESRTKKSVCALHKHALRC